MTTLSNAELAMLSLIMEQPSHAYQIEQVIEERNIRYWTEIGFSSIYRILSKLEENGWLSAQMKPPEGKGPARKVYQVTPAGEKAWQEAALESLAHPDKGYSSFLLGLDNLGSLPPDDALVALKTYLADQQTLRHSLGTAVDQHPLKDDFYIATFFDYLLHQLDSEIDWLQQLIPQLEDHYQK